METECSIEATDGVEVYESPRIEEIGDFRELTLGTGSNEHIDDHNGVSMNL